MKKVLLFILCILFIFTFTSCKNKKQNITDGDFVFKMNGKKFTIINFTDVHLTRFDDIEPDTLVYKTIAHAAKEEKPDVFTFTGDTCLDRDVLTCYQKICDVMDTFEIPYFFIFGNHDLQHATPEEINEIVDKSKFGHLIKGPDNLENYGNYTIDIKNNNGKTLHRLIMMNSGMGYDGEKTYEYTKTPAMKCQYLTFKDEFYYGSQEYDNVKGEQLNWYVNQVKDIGIESTLLMHIPFIEYHYAIEAYYLAEEAKDTKTLNTMKPMGQMRMREAVYSPPISYGFFDLIKQYGSTKNVIVGHDHINDFSLVYQGVRLTQSLKTANLGYWLDKTMTGYTKIEINSKGVATPSHIYYYPN